MTDKERKLTRRLKLALFDFFGHGNYKFHLGALDISTEIPLDERAILSYSNMDNERIAEFLRIINRYLKSETEQS